MVFFLSFPASPFPLEELSTEFRRRAQRGAFVPGFALLPSPPLPPLTLSLDTLPSPARPNLIEIQ